MVANENSAEYRKFTGLVDRLLNVSDEEMRKREYRKEVDANPWLAHLCGFGNGGNSCRWCRDFDLGLALLIDSHRAPFKKQ